MLIEPVIAVGIGFHWSGSQAGSLTNKMLVGHPEFFRVHKGFVIKPRWHQATKDADYTHHIEVDTGPAIDTGRFKTLIEFYLSGF